MRVRAPRVNIHAPDFDRSPVVSSHFELIRRPRREGPSATPAGGDPAGARTHSASRPGSTASNARLPAPDTGE